MEVFEENKIKRVEENAKFIVNTEIEVSKNLHIRIMLALRQNFYDLYEINAVGRANCKAAENAVDKLNRYIQIDSVHASRKNAQPILAIRIMRNPRFTEVFYRKKTEVMDKRLMLAMVKNSKEENK